MRVGNSGRRLEQSGRSQEPIRKDVIRCHHSSRHEGVARFSPGEDARVQGVAGFGAWEVSLVRPRDHPVLVHTLRRTPHNRLEILAEISGLEVGVKLGGELVAQVLGVLRVVVAADAPGVLVFGEVAGDELDRVEGVGLTGLAGGEHSAVDCLLGDLFQIC